MKLIDIEDDKETEAVSAVTGAWKQPKFDFERNKNDPYGLVDLSKGSNFAKLSMTLKTFNFADNTTMHGMRYVFMRDVSRLRRFVWFSIVVTGLSYWCYLVSQTFKSYYEYPTTTQIKHVFEKKSELPAVTICDLNTLLKSKLTEKEQAIVGHIFAFNPLPPNISLSDYDHVDLREFFREKGPTYSSQYCVHKSLPCNSSLLSYHLTDYGRCMTFDPALDEASKYQTSPGTQSGFYLAAFFSIDEWVQGPYYFEEGFRILIHEAGTTPLTLISDGIPVNPSFIFEIAITRHETTLLPPPHGECGQKSLKYYDDYSRDKCLLECRTEHTLSICGCRLYYMPGEDQFCTIRQMQTCQQLILFPPNDTYLFDSTTCGCPQDCTTTRFEYRMAQSKPATAYTDNIEKTLNIKLREAVAIRIFYQDLGFYEDVEEAIYTTEKLLCDVGGAAGLFLGCSFITIMEFLDFIVEFGWFWVAREVLRRKKRNPEVDVYEFK